MKYSPFTFEKKDGKWINRWDGRWFFELYQTYGLPLEMSIEEVKSFTPKQIENMKVRSWIKFAEENNVDVEVEKKKWHENKEAVMPLMKELEMHWNER